jgi:Beta-propeller repeat
MRKIALGVSSVVCLAVVLVAGSSVLKRGSHVRGAGNGRTAGAAVVAVPARANIQAGSEVVTKYGRLPLAFEPNLGQANPEAKFLARGAGYELFLTPKESVFVLNTGEKKSITTEQSSGLRPAASGHSAAVLRMRLLGANKNPVLTSQNELPGKSNYLSGKKPENWRTNVPNYRSVREEEAFPGIDLVYYGTQGQLEYDFVVAPGADPGVIRFAVEGASKLSTSSDGDLLVGIGGGEVRFHKPFAYQKDGSSKTVVAANYVLEGKDRVAFKLGNYDSRRELVIDPILSYSTYLGGSNIDGANAIAVAPDHTAFIAGGTFSTDFPTAGTHPLQPNHGGPDDFSKDAFVAKLSADGQTVLYATYLGGKNQDFANGIAVDNVGDAYVVGTTLSPDFPVTPGSMDVECGGDGKCGASWNPGGLIVENGFISKLNPAGSALIYSAFIGVYENVEALAVAVDADQNAYVTGHTSDNITPTVVITPPNQPPPPFPISGNAFQPGFGGGTNDAFVMKVSATGLSILYSSYLGGSDEDSAHGIAVDALHNIYVTGLTYSVDLPLAGGLQASGGAGDVFVSKISSTGSLVFSTYLGGAGLDQGNGIAVDSVGDTYVTGGSDSTGLATSGVLQTTMAGQGDAFIAKYSTSLPAPALVYFTYLGGSKADSGAGIAVDSSGNAYVTGSTVSTDFTTTTDAFQRTYGGGNADAFITKVDAAGATILYSSFLGGTNTESGNAIAIDSNSPPGAYVAGQTCSLDFPLSNPAQATPGGNCDAFASKIGVLEGIAINPTGLTFAPQTQGTTSQTQTVTLVSGVSPVTITSISLTGANSGDFAIVTNTCGAMLAANSQCTITVDFTPSAPGNRSAFLSIVDDVAGQPPQSLVASLSGSTSTVPDFSVTTTTPTVTVSAGQSATVTLQVTPVNSFSQPINLVCNGLPAGASCAITPNPVVPTGSTSTAVTVTIHTAVRNLLPPSFRIKMPPFDGVYRTMPYLAWLTLFFLIAVLAQSRRRPGFAGIGFVVLLVCMAAGCGGGNSTGVPAGTQAGTYTVTIAATSGSLTHNTTLALVVK